MIVSNYIGLWCNINIPKSISVTSMSTIMWFGHSKSFDTLSVYNTESWVDHSSHCKIMSDDSNELVDGYDALEAKTDPMR